MKIHEDGSATLDKWDIRAVIELGAGKWTDKQINAERNKITRTILHKFWYILKYPAIKKSHTLYEEKN